LPVSELCQSWVCGEEPNGCGGLESCGECPDAAPYCYLGSCSANEPHKCPAGEGFEPDSGACVECNACCPALTNGYCTSVEQIECVCITSPPVGGVEHPFL
jgi:hypothetical protein